MSASSDHPANPCLACGAWLADGSPDPDCQRVRAAIGLPALPARPASAAQAAAPAAHRAAARVS